MIAHSKPTIGDQEYRAIVSILCKRQLSYDTKEVRLFEEEFAKFIGVRYAIATNSGSSALHLALLGLDIKKGDTVILPTYCCAAVLNAVNYISVKPLLADIDYETYNINPSHVKTLLSKKVKAIIVPHMFGLPADMKRLKEFGIPLIEDCAMAIGGNLDKKKLGSFGEVVVTSFYATKVLTTGLGGMVFTNSKTIRDRIYDLICYDNRDDYKVRYNYGMNAISASIGRVQLKNLPSFLKRRRQIAEFYYSELMGLPIKLPIMGNHIFYRYVIDIGDGIGKFVKFMKESGIECKRPVYKPLHQYFSQLRGEYPVADKVHETCVSIPIYPFLTMKEAKTVVNAIKSFWS